MATDSLGHTVAYVWTASCPAALGNNGRLGTIANARTPTWTAPVNTTGVLQTCTLTVTANDGVGGRTANAAYTQFVQSAAHTLTFTTAPGGTPNPVVPGAAVAVTATATDSLPAHTVAYAWTASCPRYRATSGSFGATANQQAATWTAPANPTGTEQACTLTATADDGAGGRTASASFIQRVTGCT